MGWNNSSFSVRKDYSLTSKSRDTNKQVTVQFDGNEHSGFNLVGGSNELFTKSFHSKIKQLKKLHTKAP